MKVTVSNPTKTSDKFSQYISYKVTSSDIKVDKLISSGDQSREFIVERRYSDFVWLSIELSREFPGSIIPALPDKQSIGRFSQEFVESRRRALEKFLLRILIHPELCTCDLLLTFLQADEPTFIRVKEHCKQVAKKMGSTAAYTWFGDTVTHLSKNADIERSPADLKIDEISQYISALEKQMQNVAKHSEFLVKRSRETASAVFEFGQSVTYLGQSEGDSLGAALTKVGETAVMLERTATTHAELEATELEEPMEEYVQLIASVKFAMQQRHEKKMIYINALNDLEAKQAALNKVQGVAGKEEMKLQLVEKAREAVDLARSDLETVSARFLAEFEDFKRQKAIEIRGIILSFISLQIEYNRKAERSWGELYPVLQTIASQSPTNSTSSSSSSSSSKE